MRSNGTPSVDWLTGVPTPKRYSMEKVFTAVCRVFRVPEAGFRTGRKTPLFVHMRDCMVYAMREYSGKSFPEIAAFFDGDHSGTNYSHNESFKKLPEEVKYDLLVRIESELQRMERER